MLARMNEWGLEHSKDWGRSACSPCSAAADKSSKEQGNWLRTAT